MASVDTFSTRRHTNDGREIIGTTNAVFSARTGELATRDEIDRSGGRHAGAILYFDRRDGALKALNTHTAGVGARQPTAGHHSLRDSSTRHHGRFQSGEASGSQRRRRKRRCRGHC
jgi:hypothetical protein